jgi:hypothetical protein
MKVRIEGHLVNSACPYFFLEKKNLFSHEQRVKQLVTFSSNL